MRVWKLVAFAGVFAQLACHFDSTGAGAYDPGPGEGMAQNDAGASTTTEHATSSIGDEQPDAATIADGSATASATGGDATTTDGVAATTGTHESASTSGTTSAGEGTAGSSGDTTGDEDRLIDRELLARYFLDDAAYEASPTTVQDATAHALDLPIVSTDNMTFENVDGHHGLSWRKVDVNGRAMASVADTKLQQGLNGQTGATFELVVEIWNMSSSGSRLLHLGTSSRFDVTIGALSPDVLVMVTGQGALNTYDTYADWNLDLSHRVVLHVVYDASQAAESDRATVYADGVEVTGGSGSFPSQGATISLGNDGDLVLGNRNDGQRSFEGNLFYTAIYGTALTPEEIAHNAAALQQSDDF